MSDTIDIDIDGRSFEAQKGEMLIEVADRNGIVLRHNPRAAELLGHPYLVEGTVVRGRGIGRTLEFPTANVDV